MKIDFRQGIISYPTLNNIQQFLVYNGNSVTLSSLYGRIDVSFAHKTSNYTLTENLTIDDAWSTPASLVTYWLYWELSARDGVRTFGTTIIPPVSGPTAPASPSEDLHWFDTTNTKMMWYHLGGWREVIRVFAGSVNTGTFVPMGNSISAPYAGTQVGLSSVNNSTGRILYTADSKPIRRSDGTFLTTENDMLVNGTHINQIKIDNSIITVTASENVAKYSVVKLNTFDHIVQASFLDTQTSLVAVALDDALIGTACQICVTGVISNPNWNFPIAGQELWISSTTPGTLTSIDPNVANPINFPEAKVPVARVISPTTIYFDQGMGGVGQKGDSTSGLIGYTVDTGTALGVGAGTSHSLVDNITAIGYRSLMGNISGVSNTAVGRYALSTTTSNNNTAVGDNALRYTTTGQYNIGLGSFALTNNTIGLGNIGIGDSSLPANINGNGNIGIGDSVLFSSIAGSYNVAIGDNSLYDHIGSYTVAVGANSLFANTSGTFNTAVGSNSISSNIDGMNNTAVGYNTLVAGVSTIGVGSPVGPGHNDNTAIGSNSLTNNTSGENTAIGSNSLTANSSGSNNTVVGYNAGSLITTGANNVIVGNYPGISTTSGLLALGISTSKGFIYGNVDGIYVGAVVAPTSRLHLPAGGIAANSSCLKFTSGSLLTTPEDGAFEYNGTDVFFTIGSTRTSLTAVGGGSLTGYTTSLETGLGIGTVVSGIAGNTAIGYNALQVNTVANNTAVGYNALPANTTGSSNTAIGTSSLLTNIGGSQNVAIGHSSLILCNSTSNTAVGYAALNDVTSGANNIALGWRAGVNLTTGSNNVIIGGYTGSPGLSNVLAIGQTGNNSFIYGNATGIYIGAVTNPTARLHLPAGGIAANSSCLKLTSGSLLTTPEDGAFEYNGTDVFFTIGSTRTSLTAVGGGGGSLTGYTNAFETGLGIGTAASGTAGNTAIGTNALQGNTSGLSNTAVGNNTLLATSVGGFNTAVGAEAMMNSDIGGCVAIGYQSLLSNSIGQNVAVGYQSQRDNVIGSNNTSIGTLSLSANLGYYNTAVGHEASLTGSSNVNHNRNTAVGHQSLMLNTTGNNTAVGFSSLLNNSTGTPNTAVGTQALQNNTTGNHNTAVGYQTLMTGTTTAAHNRNTAVGHQSLRLNTAGDNTAVGYLALTANSTGTTNTAVGKDAGKLLTTGSNNTILGNHQGVAGNAGILAIGIDTSFGFIYGNTTGLYVGAVVAPTARLHLPAGTAAASTAPVKLTAGTLMTTPEDGALEFDGTNLYFTIGGVRKIVTLV